VEVCSGVVCLSGSGRCCCWLTKSVFSGTALVAFSGVSCNSPPKCFSQVGRSENLGSSGSSEPSAAAEVCSS